MEASLAGRRLEISGLAIPRQATMPAPTGSGLAETNLPGRTSSASVLPTQESLRRDESQKRLCGLILHSIPAIAFQLFSADPGPLVITG